LAGCVLLTSTSIGLFFSDVAILVCLAVDAIKFVDLKHAIISGSHQWAQKRKRGSLCYSCCQENDARRGEGVQIL
jgi:hypothetical protein